MPQVDPSHSAYAGVRVLLLGATGFIGRWVARALSVQGADLHLAVRDQGKMRGLLRAYAISGAMHEFDALREERATSVVTSVRPAITFNLAGYGVARSERDERAAYQINDRLVARLADAVAEGRYDSWPGQQLIHVGSALEYGPVSGDLVESTSPQPTTLYGKSKLAGTQRLAERCATHNVRGLTARLFTVYGPGEHDGRLLPTLRDATGRAGTVALSLGTQKRDFAFVEDIADGLLRLGAVEEANPGEVVNLATGRLWTVRAFVEAAAGLLGIEPARLQFGALPTRDEEMSHDPVSVDRLRALTGWLPPDDIRAGLRRAIAYSSQLEGRSGIQGGS